METLLPRNHETWRTACRLIRELADDPADPARCGWHGSAADVEMVADYLDKTSGVPIPVRAEAAEAYIEGEIAARRTPSTYKVLEHLRARHREFGNG